MTRVALASFLLVVGVAAAAEPITEHIRNFDEVNPMLLRGGAPTEAALQELKSLGVGLIVDLRENGAKSSLEKEKAEQLGMRYAHIPLRPMGAPREPEVEQILALLEKESASKIYLHCLRGKDRTGTIIACYRIRHDGWKNQDALVEARAHGMSHLQKAMQSFVLHFTPINLVPIAQPVN